MPLFGPPDIEKLKAKGDVIGLIKALRHKDATIRQKAAGALGGLGDLQAVKALIAALADETSSVRQAAAEGLGRLGDPRAVEPLGAALNDRSSRVRAAAAGALGQLGDARALEALTNALDDRSKPVRSVAERALAKITSPDEAKRLARQARLESAVTDLNSRDRVRRHEAISVLMDLNDPHAIEALVRVLRESGDIIHEGGVYIPSSWAIDQLEEFVARLGAAGVERLVVALRDESGDVLHRSLKGIVKLEAAAMEPLLATLDHEDARVRSVAAWALAELVLVGVKDPAAVEPLLSALDDKSRDTRETAVDALGALGDERAVVPLTAMLYDLSLSWRACRALERIDGPEAERALADWTSKKEGALADWRTATATRRAHRPGRCECLYPMCAVGHRPGQCENEVQVLIVIGEKRIHVCEECHEKTERVVGSDEFGKYHRNYDEFGHPI